MVPMFAVAMAISAVSTQPSLRARTIIAPAVAEDRGLNAGQRSTDALVEKARLEEVTILLRLDGRELENIQRTVTCRKMDSLGWSGIARMMAGR